VQRGRAVPKNRNRFDGTSYVSITANTQAGSVSAGVTSPAGRHAAHDGQRRHLLRSSLPLHLHFQVFPGVSFEFRFQLYGYCFKNYSFEPSNVYKNNAKSKIVRFDKSFITFVGVDPVNIMKLNHLQCKSQLTSTLFLAPYGTRNSTVQSHPALLIRSLFAV